jgi:hypothetical protein
MHHAVTKLLESLGLEGFPLFVAAAGVSIVILSLSYLIATRGLQDKRTKK